MTPLLTGRRIAVIGATGFIGSHLVERLVLEGAEVLAVSRTLGGFDRLANVSRACAFALCDITMSSQIRKLLRIFRPDTVFHLAAHPDAAESFTHMAACINVNTLAVVHTLEAAAEAGVGLFVYGDSSKVYGNSGVPYTENNVVRPTCSYAVAKAAAWDFCTLGAAASGTIQVVGLRPTFVYGPRQSRNLITYIQECVATGRPVRLMGGTQTRDPLHIEDAVSAFVAAACRREARGHAIPIGGGREISVAELCRRVLAELGSALEPVIGGENPRPTEIWRSCSGNREAAELLEWRPRVSLAEGLRRTLTMPVEAPAINAREVRLSLDTPAPKIFVHDAGPIGTFAVIDRRAAARAASATAAAVATARAASGPRRPRQEPARVGTGRAGAGHAGVAS